MNWYLHSSNDSDVLMNLRLRLLRNIDSIKFPIKASEEEFKKVYDKFKEITPSLGYGLDFFEVDKIDEVTMNAMYEKGLITKEFVSSKNPYRAIIVNGDENIVIQINGENHVDIGVFASGKNFDELLALAVEIDQKIEDYVKYAYSEKYGYLTSSPRNVGTGLKLYARLHLPGLEMTNNTNRVFRDINTVGISARELYSQDSDIYEISNNQTIGVREEDIVNTIKIVAMKLIEEERKARKFLCKNSIELEDIVYRDFGELKYARKISEAEALEKLSKVKMGVDLGIIKEIDDAKVMKLMIYTRLANLQRSVSKKLTKFEENVERAKKIKEIIDEE